MENRFSNRDFEDFVKQNADQYRMYPSEKVWKNINYSLHTRRRWLGIGLSLLLLTTGAVTWLMIESGKNKQATAYKPIAFTNQQASTKSTPEESPKIYVTARKNNGPKLNNLLRDNSKLTDKLFIADQPAEEYNSNDFDYTVAAAVTPVIMETKMAQNRPVAELNTRSTTITPRKYAHEKLAVATVNPEKSTIPVSLNENKPALTTAPSEDFTKKEEKKELYPMTIESVINEYKHARSRKPISWEVYFSPTISYRTLKENKAFINSTLANNNSLNYYTAISDINSLVTHKPDIGLQMGFSAGYPLTKNLKVIAGMQFNVSKYDIRAYTYNSEVATIALNTGGGSNSVSTTTTYRNFSGDNASWLRNLYISASMPVGLELKFNKIGNTELGIAATVQPTYMLGDRVYLLSTDYKNYVEMPSLTRKWNFSGGVEAFAGLSTGKIQWRVGPHVRYQMLSTFDKKYPVKEHLFDFGVKVGIMLKK